MFKTAITLTIIWVILAFSWDPFVSIVDKTQAVDKTKEKNRIRKGKETWLLGIIC